MIDLLVEHGNRMALAAVGRRDRILWRRAGPGRRRASPPSPSASAEYNIGITAQWTDPAETATHIAWARAMYDAFEPHSSGSHLLNFLSEAGDDVIRAAFGDNYARLAEVKRKYDPTQFLQPQPEHQGGELTAIDRGVAGPRICRWLT